MWWAGGLGEPTSTHQVHQKTLLRCSVVLVAVPRLCCPLLRGFNGGHQKTQGDNAPSRQAEYPLPLRCTRPLKVHWAAASAAAMLQPMVRAAEQHQIGHRPRGGTHGMEWVTTQGPAHCFPDTTTGSGCGNPVAPRPYRCARTPSIYPPPLVQETLGPDINAVAAWARASHAHWGGGNKHGPELCQQ